MSSRPAAPLRALLPVLFLATGAAGLIYEVVWFRLLETIFGVTALATSTVLAVFMGGLALGAQLASRRADRLQRPLRAYGVLEIALAATALAIPWALPLANRAFVLFYDALQPSFFVLSILRLLVSAIILLPPATLMGATLPILARAFAREDAPGRDVGLLYTVNTLGALAGAAIGGFVLLPALGLRGALLVAVGLNLAAGLPAFLLGGRVGNVARDAEAAGAAAEKRAPVPPPLLILSALSGLCALAYQVFWTRALLLSIGNTVYAFTVILVTVLLGITIGSAVATFLLGRTRRPLLVLAVSQIAVAFAVVVMTSFFDDLPRLFFDLSQKWGGSWGGFLAVGFALSALGMLPATILLGMGLPLVLGEAVRGRRGLAHDVGSLYAVNTWAGIAGSLAAGFILIPLVGIRAGLLAMAAGNGITGILALRTQKDIPRARLLPVAIGFIALFAVAVSILPPWNADALTSGLHTSGKAGDGAASGERVVYYKEGIAATVSVKRRGRDLKLQVNGRTEATSIGDLKTNTLLGSLPFLLRPQAQSALVIGLGSGVTLAAAAQHPLQSIECVELSGEVVEASRLFTAAMPPGPRRSTPDPTLDPRVRMRAEDGRNHLLLTRKKYDVIISQPSNLWAAGVGNLFTHEFFELCRDHLVEGGVLCQWIQGYSVSKSSLRSILFTLSQSFPHVDVWVGEWSDLLVTASATPVPLSFETVARAFDDPAIGASLKRAGVGDALTLLSHHMLDAAAVKLLTEGARLHTDDNRLVEFGEPKSIAQGTVSNQSLDLLAWETDVRERLSDRFILQPGTDTNERLDLAVQARRLEIEARGREAAGRGAEAVEMLRAAAAANPRDVAIRRNLARLHVRMGVEFARRQNYAEAHANLTEAIRIDPESAEAAGNMGLLALIGGSADDALRWTLRAIELDPENESYSVQLGDVHRASLRWKEARDAYLQALAKSPEHVPAILHLAESLTYTGDPEGAVAKLESARRLGAPAEELQRIRKLVRQDG